MSEEPPWGASDRRQLEVYDGFGKEAAGQWTYLYRSWGDIGSFSGGQYSALLPASHLALPGDSESGGREGERGAASQVAFVVELVIVRDW